MIVNRNFGLDLIRVIAILLVLLAHTGIRTVCGFKIGILGVEIFFVLSGFLIGQILIREFSHGINYKIILNFWIRRWFRTLPLYYAILILKFILIDSALGWKIIVYFVFLQNNFVGIDFLPISWSLVIEEWFYIIVPILLFFFFKNGVTKQKLSFFLIAFIVFENIVRIFWVFYSQRPYSGIVGNFPFRLDSLMVGVLLAHIKINYHLLYQYLLNLKVFFAALLCLLAMILVLGNISIQGDLKDQLIWTRTIWFTLLSVIISLMIPFVATIKISSINFFGKIITSLSLYTYAMYLTHSFVFEWIIISKEKTLDWAWRAPLAILITIVISGFIFKFFEKPMMDLRDKVKF
ncbi:MAG: acyltransferase [Bacteroidia bacterium]|nr:acyltransferase [Bacteroidia bacterium]